MIICVDRDDDLGKKTGIETPIVGREKVEKAANSFALADPEDSDVNALFEGMRLYDEEEEDAELVVLTGNSGTHSNQDRAIAQQLETVLESITADSAIVVTDGAEDESVMPIIESRIKIDGVSRTVVRQSENLENAYHIVKQFLRDPETRGTILVPLGILLMIYPIDLLMNYLNYPNAALGITTAALGSYILMKGLGLDKTFENAGKKIRSGIYTGKFSMITYFVAVGLALIGMASGYSYVNEYVASRTGQVGIVPTTMAFLRGAVIWLTVAGIVSSIGRILEESIKTESFPYLYFNGPFYIVALGTVIYGVTGYFLGIEDIAYLAVLMTVSIGIGATSTAVFGGIKSGTIELREDDDRLDVES